MRKHIAVIGGGVAGMEAAGRLAANGFRVTLIEKESRLGGHVNNWDFLFPDRKPARDLLGNLRNGLSEKVDVRLNSSVTSVQEKDLGFFLNLNEHEPVTADAILITTGFDLFDASRKEEYGYGIYPQVVTSAELEEQFQSGRLNRLMQGNTGRIGILHCVGSRDKKVGNEYCSKVCCVTGVKQAMKLREKFPDHQVYCFYMDLRMFGRYFENLYKEAQEKWGVRFVRGRISEASEDIHGHLVIRFEDTLSGKPMKMSLDMLVLLTGFVPSGGTRWLSENLRLDTACDRFIKPVDEHLERTRTGRRAVFAAGSCTGPKSIAESIAEARSACLDIMNYFNQTSE